jgi:cell wall-associated NlpC family hydrolase
MTKIIFFSIFLSFVFLSCRSSARFSSSHLNDYEASSRSQEFSEKSAALDNYVKHWLNTPYKYGGMSKSGIDCSGFSFVVMRDVYDIVISRTADAQYKAGEKIRDGWRKPGDLVFFKNVRGHGIDHVGIYLGNNLFAHASTNKGVIISDLDEDYYRKRYVGICRYR